VRDDAVPAIKAMKPDADFNIAGVKDFPDQKDISSWAVEATKYMFKNGIIAGDPAETSCPRPPRGADIGGYGMATREQAIALSVRTMKRSELA
jgi:hypothetical protein